MAKLSGNLDSAGDASLQNGLDTSVGALKAIPPYGHREVELHWSANPHSLVHCICYCYHQAVKGCRGV